MATSSPVVETVSRRRVVPATEIETEKTGRTAPDFWETLENLTPQQWVDGDWRLAIVREDPKPSTYGGQNTLEQCQGVLEVRPGVSIALDDREGIQIGIKQKYGGRSYRLILKKGRERITEGKCMNEAPPKYPENNSGYPPNPLPNAPTDASVATRAIDAMASQQPEAMRLAMDVLRGASEMVMRSAQPPATPPPGTSQNSLIEATVIRTLIDRALAPPPPPQDPFALFVKFKELMQPTASNGVKETLELVTTLKNSGLIALGGGKTSLLDLGREILPIVATTARDAIHEWRVGVEAQVRGLELSRGLNPSGPGAPAVPAAPAAIGAPAAPATESAAPAAAPSGEPPFDWLAIKIVEILKEPSYTIDETVDETLSFLYRSHAPVVALLLDPPKLDPRLPQGEQGLLALFQHHSVLKQIPVNPRLVEFIKKFIAAAKEAEAERQADAKPAGPVAVPAVPPAS